MTIIISNYRHFEIFTKKLLCKVNKQKNNYCKYHSNYPWKFPLNSNRFLVEMTVYQSFERINREFEDKTIRRDNSKGSIVFA